MRGTVTWVLATVVAFLVTGEAFAGQTGGLAAPLGSGGFATSLALGYTSRDVEDGRDDEISSLRVLVRAEFGIADGIDIHGTLGFTDAEFDDLDFNGNMGETFGLGVRFRLMDFPESAVQLVGDVQGEYFRSKDGSVRVDGQLLEGSLYVVRQIGAAGRTGYFYPYLGARATYANYDLNKGIDDYEGESFIGLFAGADYFVNPNVYFNGEFHLFDETSVYVSAGYRF